MSIQIISIVLYSHDGRSRDLPLRAGAVNVITGDSKSGKSALIHIADYCFCSDECHVPEGILRRGVSWFGLRLRLKEGEAFIARKCPARKSQSSEECYVAIGTEAPPPEHTALRQTTNTAGLIALLNGWCGIADNVHEPLAGQTRKPLSATIRHALMLCFQPQDEIIQRQQLFHSTNDGFKRRDLEDVLPYFLGAVSDDYVRKRAEARRLKDKLRGIDRQLAEIAAIRGDGISKAGALLAQARELGLSTATDPSQWDDIVAELRTIASTPLAKSEGREAMIGQSEFNRLSEVRSSLITEQRRIRDYIAVARSFQGTESNYQREAGEHQSRLRPIGIFADVEHTKHCPLCTQLLVKEGGVPAVSEIQQSLLKVTSRLESVSRPTPQMDKAIANLQEQAAKLQQQLTQNRTEMEAVRLINEALGEEQDLVNRKAHLLGRLSLYLEGLPDFPGTQDLVRQAAELRRSISILEIELSDDQIQEKLGSIVSLLGQKMTQWARELKLEHSTHPIRFNLKKLTIAADTPDGPITMDKMGSGENWVGLHLIGHLALHTWFAQKDRPVPRFLFLDQPSQVYFPADRTVESSQSQLKDADRESLGRMFKLVFDAVSESGGQFQVIVSEHADIIDPTYQNAIVERWRDGLKLVPEDWPMV